MNGRQKWLIFPVLLVLLVSPGCSMKSGAKVNYLDSNMDFASIRNVAVMPFKNLTRETYASDRVRDVFMTMLQATGAVYVIPPGEVQRGITNTGMVNPMAPAPEEVIKFGKVVDASVVITGTVREYGDVRSGTTTANLVSISLQMMEAETGKVVWSASSTQGGVKTTDRLFGGGGDPMDPVTQKAINDLLDKLFGQ